MMKTTPNCYLQIMLCLWIIFAACGRICNGAEAEGTLYGAVTNVYDVLPSITKSKRPSFLVIVSDNAKCNGSCYLTYKHHILAYSVVEEVFELLVTDPDGYTNMLLMDNSSIVINGNGEACPMHLVTVK
jgi:hypothetical protein